MAGKHMAAVSKETPCFKCWRPIRRVFELAGVKFIGENGDGPGVRLGSGAINRPASGATENSQNEPNYMKSP
jgi:hypothetical protein